MHAVSSRSLGGIDLATARIAFVNRRREIHYQAHGHHTQTAMVVYVCVETAVRPVLTVEYART